MSLSLTTEISKRRSTLTGNVVVGGSFSGDCVDVLRPGSLLNIGKADFEGTPPQAPLGAIHISQGEQVMFDLGHRIGFKHPAQVSGLAPTACVWLGAEEPNLEAERCRLLFETKSVDDETRSSVKRTSGDGDLNKQNSSRVLMTKTTSLMPIIHRFFLINIIYFRDYLHMCKDSFIYYFSLFSLDYEVISSH